MVTKRHTATTYVVGAGASHHVGYPLISEMGTGLLDFMLKSSNPLYGRARNCLMDRFGQLPDMEDLITSLQEKREGDLRGVVLEALPSWFREIRKNPVPAYAALADKRVQPSDVVITFNYDDSLERELRRTGKWDISRGYGFPLGSAETSSDVVVLKLHGSVNWLASFLGGAVGGSTIVTSSGKTLGDQPVIDQVDLDSLGYTNFSGRVWKSGGALPCLVLPGRKKQFYYDTTSGLQFVEFWKLIWSQAAEALQRSDRIVVCGYSMLPVDEDACDLLLRRPTKWAQVKIVSGDQGPRIAQDFEVAGFHSVEVFKGGCFEEWVEAEI